MAARDPYRRIKSALRAHQACSAAMERLDASRRLREAAEELEAIAIAEARASGATWREIGELYGLTKQGAQQRFRGGDRSAGSEEKPSRAS